MLQRALKQGSRESSKALDLQLRSVKYSKQRSVGVQHRALCRSLQVSIGFRGNQLYLQSSYRGGTNYMCF